MDIVGIFKESFETAKKNYILCVPTVAAEVVTVVLTLILVGAGAISVGLTGSGTHVPGAMMGGVFLVGVFSILLGLVAHGMTVGMAKEAVETGTTSLGSGLSIAMSRLGQLIVASVLVGITVAIGFMLFIVPGLIAIFFLMFTFVSVIVDSAGAVDAMKKSYSLVKTNLNDSLVFFAGTIAIGVVFAAVNAVLNVIPALGQLLGMVLMGAFGGYIAVAVVRVYREMTGAGKKD